MNPVQSIVDYIRTATAELKKVAWPSRKDTIRYSALVIGISVVVAAVFAALDTGLHTGVQALLARKTPTAQTTTQTKATALPINPSGVDVQAVNPTTGQPTPVTVTPAPLPKK